MTAVKLFKDQDLLRKDNRNNGGFGTTCFSKLLLILNHEFFNELIHSNYVSNCLKVIGST